ncbi:hypothetical protein J6590_075324 [Homalodisca vitripennis]|nr:hypothetical protein J6590_075324 [Homalodisca vitripennis]
MTHTILSFKPIVKTVQDEQKKIHARDKAPVCVNIKLAVVNSLPTPALHYNSRSNESWDFNPQDRNKNKLIPSCLNELASLRELASWSSFVSWLRGLPSWSSFVSWLRELASWSSFDEASLTRHAMYVTLATEPNMDTESNLMNVKKIEKMSAALLAPDLFERGLHTAHCYH